MSYVRIIALSFVTLALAGNVFAATASPSASPTSTTAPTPNTKQLQIESLKERLATKVAELRQTQSKAVFGTVKSISVSTLVIETKTKDVKIDLTDDIKVAQILKGVRTKLTIEDVKKGDEVTIFGTYDSTLDLLKAKYIFIQNKPPERVTGVVTEINRDDFTLTIGTTEERSIVIDIETTSRTVRWDGTGIVKSGFSKIAIGDMLHVQGTAVPKKENRYSAVRILDLGNLSGNAPSPVTTPTPIESPTIKATSSATLTPSPTSKAK